MTKTKDEQEKEEKQNINPEDKQWQNSSIRGDLLTWVHENDQNLSKNLKFLIKKLANYRDEINTKFDFQNRKTQVYTKNFKKKCSIILNFRFNSHVIQVVKLVIKLMWMHQKDQL